MQGIKNWFNDEEAYEDYTYSEEQTIKEDKPIYQKFEELNKTEINERVKGHCEKFGLKQQEIKLQGKYEDFETTLKEDSLILLLIGGRGCMPKGTLIKTEEGLKPIEQVKKVLSYNFEKKQIETKQAKVFDTGNKQIVKIHTSKGIIKCSPTHKWIVWNTKTKQREVIETKDLNINYHEFYLEDDTYANN